MIILKILTDYVQEEGCEPEVYQWVAIDGDRCVVMRRLRHNIDRCDHERKEIVYKDLYGITVQDNPHDLALTKEVLDALTQAVQGKHDTAQAVEVELRRRPWSAEEKTRFEFQEKVAKAKAAEISDPDV
ncbi:MAG: hypothetical protein Q7S37_02940 [bacterium]|nr:hypothetical protein [bacterium]